MLNLNEFVLDDVKESNFLEESHRRCVAYGISEDQVISKKIIEGDELNQRLLKKKDLIIAAKPFIDKLYDFVKGSDFFTMLTDEEGCILMVTGDDLILEKARRYKMIPGAYMSEDCIGTNAMGTSIAENRPVQISGKEHFIKAYHMWTCSGAPIHDVEGNIIGSLDLTGNCDAVHSHTLGMVVSAVTAIESIMSLNKKNRLLKDSNVLIESLFNSIKEGIVHVDLNGDVLSSNDQACKMFGYQKGVFEALNIRSLVTDWEKVQHDILTMDDYQNEDVIIQARTNKLYFNLNAYKVNEGKEVHGIILMFNDIKKVRKLAHKIYGRKAVYTFDKIIGCTPKMLDLIAFGKKVADSRSTVLITGESGCGKEIFAQAIHNYSRRAKEAFVAINCGAIPRNLMESEFFGYDDGAFTGAKRGGQVGKFEVADGGTIFLDEIGEMPLEMQTKLLRSIEESTIVRVGGSREITVDVRIIAATNKNLKDEVRKGNFRQDLYYRLYVIPMEIMPLRERPEDIPLLVEYFMQKIAYRINKKPLLITEHEMDLLKGYSWPGNVRELENFIELAINKERLPVEFLKPENILEDFKDKNVEMVSLKFIEKEHIERVLHNQGHNISNTAKVLGIGRNTLYRKLNEYLIEYERV
ncbi:sigma-54-dependent Fis family transcriptional regulator [Serpentinicella alkaliphila]|uniref:PAS domain S-box-containing protein n=1 Tax=Serpentinicella alkaliphila TaxID=1734049 RepID=A0A4R2UJU5_9FIRM|nr:sigma-54-dependent Fis family transcriptional regulator [Serpentinicella alkaliphila]QUH26854.1 sigma-54-dependent Fis family transcriptional regulator [Serpentinicella alkaliphila]TCQ08083.1 PAS domain S-box-containing protein [Serpentinicella alkaliphila]